MDIDAALRRLSEDPVPLRLKAVEEQVIERVGSRPFVGGGDFLCTRVALVAVALGMGIAGGLASEAAAEPKRDTSLIAGVEELAPSSLLSGPL